MGAQNMTNGRKINFKIAGVALAVMLMISVGGTVFGAPDQAVPHLDHAVQVAGVAGAPSSGFIAPGFQTAHYASAVAVNFRAEKSLPSRYDARALGLVTPVKNQGECGACYAFSSAADLESKILKEGFGAFDLSENSMKECHYQGSGCLGGNQYRIMNYLATTGAVLETCDPYTPVDVSCTLGCAAQFSVLDYSSISGSTIAPTAVIKQYLMDYGPIHTTVFAGDDSQPTWRDQVAGYDGTGALFYAGTDAPNHSVLIVGWDDSIIHAGGQGAWIIKNSWGTTWGGTCDYGTERGYFYIAYESANVGMYSSFVKAFMVNDDQMGLLYHDEGGYTSAFGGLGTVMWGMGAFTATSETKLHRVEFWTSDATVDVDVYVYDVFSGGALNTLLTSSLDNAFSEPGYHYVELDEPLPLTTGETFYVAVRFENQTYEFPLAADGDGPADPNMSWYSFNGTSWSSLEPHGVDVTIRVRTSTNAVLAIEDRNGQDGDDQPAGDLPHNLVVAGAYPNPFNPTTNISYTLPQAERVRVGIFDLKGRQIRRLVDEDMSAGPQITMWDGMDDQGRSMPSGVYFCRVEAGFQVRGIKLALLK